MEVKKISFGFSKSNKKPNVIVKSATQNQESNKIELIKCLEGQEIKLVEEKREEAPLVIPVKESQKTSAALASLMKRRAVLLGEDEPMELNTAAEIAEDTNAVINATDDIEKRAAQELLADLKASSTENPATNLVLPVVHPDDLPLEGAKEPSLDDYDNIPIEQFGKAMLRGMGWVEPPKTTKGVAPLDDSPMVRPKGMGLGADKALKAKPLLVAPESNEVLEIKRNAFVRILGGKHKDLYGQIEGFDDHAGRVIVKMAIGGIKEAFNEFLCQPISRKEFAQYGKCINSTKYEEYKTQQNEYGQIILKKEEIDSSVDKRSMKLEKIKNETQLISSDECKKVERKPIKKEERSPGSRKSNYDDSNIKFERNFKSEFKREEERDRFTKRENAKDYELDHKMERYDRRNREDRRSKEQGDKDHMERNRDIAMDCLKHSRPSKRERNRDASRDRRESKYDTESVEHRKHTNKYMAKEEQQRDCGERKSRQDNTHSSESDNDDENKYKKSSKDRKFQKKPKKSKKRKSSRQDSDTESSALSAPNSSNAGQQRHSRHKKKTKKSKKERDRSRSRGRR